MANLAVQIVRFVDESNPGVVACEFTDADGRTHTVIDKVPIFTTEQLWWDSKYPTFGSMECDVLARWQDETGRELARISSFDSTEGVSEFVVLSSQLAPGA